MKKSLMLGGVLVALLIAGAGIAVSPALAYTPPGQGTDNATDVILWQGDTTNINATASMSTLEDDMTAAFTAAAGVIADEVSDIADSIFIFLFCFGLAFLGLKSRIMRITAGVSLIVSGWTFFPSTALTIIMVISGLGLISDAVAKGRRDIIKSE